MFRSPDPASMGESLCRVLPGSPPRYVDLFRSHRCAVPWSRGCSPYSLLPVEGPSRDV